MEINWLLTFIATIGFVLLYSSWSISNIINNSTTCSSKLKQTNQIVLVIGLISVIVPLILTICGCKSLFGKDDLVNSQIIHGFIIIIGFILLILGSIISSASINCDNAKNHSVPIWLSGVLLIVGVLVLHRDKILSKLPGSAKFSCCGDNTPSKFSCGDAPTKFKFPSSFNDDSD